MKITISLAGNITDDKKKFNKFKSTDFPYGLFNTKRLKNIRKFKYLAKEYNRDMSRLYQLGVLNDFNKVNDFEIFLIPQTNRLGMRADCLRFTPYYVVLN